MHSPLPILLQTMLFCKIRIIPKYRKYLHDLWTEMFNSLLINVPFPNDRFSWYSVHKRISGFDFLLRQPRSDVIGSELGPEVVGLVSGHLRQLGRSPRLRRGHSKVAKADQQIRQQSVASFGSRWDLSFDLNILEFQLCWKSPKIILS